jgi:hypothetical protein
MQPCVSYVILSRVNTHHAQPDMLRTQHHHQQESLHLVSPAFSRCYADPSRQHMIHGRRANQNACFLIDRDPPQTPRWSKWHAPHVFSTQTFKPSCLGEPRDTPWWLDLVRRSQSPHFDLWAAHLPIRDRPAEGRSCDLVSGPITILYCS